MDLDVSKKELESFRRFLSLLPHGKDTELVLLKAHILIDEQIHQIINGRVKNPDALKDGRLECHQAICLAQSFFPPEFQPFLWDALKKLNKMRNDIAHKAENTGLHDRIEGFITEYPWGFQEMEDKVARFELSLWSLFAHVARLVESPEEKVIELAHSNSE